jgi:hypothetical protein
MGAGLFPVLISEWPSAAVSTRLRITRDVKAAADWDMSGLYLLEGVPVTVCAVATVAWEGSPGVAVSGECSGS